MRESRLLPFVAGVVGFVALALAVLSAAAFLGGAHRMLELASHFRLQYLVGSAICLLALLCLRSWRWAVAAAVGVLLNGVVVAPWYWPASRLAGTPGGTPLRVLLVNVFLDNPNSGALFDLVKIEQPDVIVLEEIDARWVAELKDLEDSWPHRFVVPRNDNFGIGIWSRYPLADARTVALGDSALPSISARVEVKGQSVALLATHPPPPVTHQLFSVRNSQYLALAEFARTQPGPLVVLGDLNTSMWSPHYLRLIRDSGLADARRGFGVLPTWPSEYLLFQAPLDHCLLSPGVGVAGIRVGRPIGSDHLPVVADLILPPKAP